MLAASLEQEDIKRLDDILVEMKAEEVVATLADRLTEVETLGDTLCGGDVQGICRPTGLKAKKKWTLRHLATLWLSWRPKSWSTQG